MVVVTFTLTLSDTMVILILTLWWFWWQTEYTETWIKTSIWSCSKWWKKPYHLVKTVKRRRRLKKWRLMKMMRDGYQVFPWRFGLRSFRISVGQVFSGVNSKPSPWLILIPSPLLLNIIYSMIPKSLILGAKEFAEPGVRKFTIWLPLESFKGIFTFCLLSINGILT